MQNDFQKQLIKGKIAELVFQQMIAEAGKYTILPLGYEQILPGLVDWHNNDILKPIRSAPDFVLIPKDEADENILIVEVKFRRSITRKDNFERASEQNKRWNPSYLLVATPGRFYFGKCAEIIKKNGMMGELSDGYVPFKMQEKYINILKEFLDK
jgi:hypothetical protein